MISIVTKLVTISFDRFTRVFDEPSNRMLGGLEPVQLVEETEQRLGEKIPPEQIEAIHDAVLTDEVLRSVGYAETVYLVIGNYDEATKPRLLETRDVLDRRSPNHLAFLLDEVDPDVSAWQNFYVKFKIFTARADWIVGVFENNDGGHELEAGEVPREKLYVFKREYDDRAREHEAFDAMIASLFEVLDNEGRLIRWDRPAELPNLVDEHVP